VIDKDEKKIPMERKKKRKENDEQMMITEQE
jgi:hypothetical protein